MTAQSPQLIMRKTNMAVIPRISRPDGVTLHTHIPGNEEIWENIVERAFGAHFDFDSSLTSRPGYKPEHVFYLAKDGRDIATVSAIEKETYPGEGWLHMVAVDPDAQGLGLSFPLVAVALSSFRSRGFASVVLSTDDFRLPAIKTYLRLGFEPLMDHESYPARWDAIFAKIRR